MNNKQIKEAFGQIRAEDTLKNRTKEYIWEKTKKSITPIPKRLYAGAALCACVLILFLFGIWGYFIPTAGISIDINPSFELGINRFGRVISVKGFNSDGNELSNTLDLKFRPYEEAVNRILENKKISVLLSNEEIMSITVTGPDENQSAEILSKLEVCAEKQKNIYCYSSSSEEVSAAHEAGLSCGKYRAFLELQALDPTVTPQTVQDMTMKEIRDLIDRLSSGNQDETPSEADDCHGSEKGHGWKKGHKHISQ